MSEFTNAEQRYNRWVLLAMAVYGGVLLIHRLVAPARSSALAAVFAVLAALPVLAVFAAMARYLAIEHDEYVRARTVRQLLWATGGMLAISTLWGFLAEAGAPQPPLSAIAIIWFACMGIAALVRRLIER
jgi:drug/metabolite transporter (DMT)-like permease